MQKNFERRFTEVIRRHHVHVRVRLQREKEQEECQVERNERRKEP